MRAVPIPLPLVRGPSEAAMSLVLWCLALTITLLALRAEVREMTRLPSVKIILLPGLFLALASKLLACLLGGAALREVRLPWRAGEPIEHAPPAVPVFGRLFLGILPFAAAVVAILILREVLAPTLVFAEAELPPLVAGPEAPQAVLDGVAELARSTLLLIQEPSLRDLRVGLFVYLALAFLVFTAPTCRDWVPLAVVFSLMALSCAALEYFGVRAGFLSRGWWIQYLYGAMVLENLVLLLALALLALIAFGILRIVWHPQPQEEAKPAAKPEPRKKTKKKA